MDFLRLRQQLRERRQNLWDVKKFPEDHMMVRFRVGFVNPSYPSCGHRDGILSHRVHFVFSSCDHQCLWVLFISRKQYEWNKKVPDCLRKATLRETFALPSWSPRIKEIFNMMTSGSDHSVYKDDWLKVAQNFWCVINGNRSNFMFSSSVSDLELQKVIKVTFSQNRRQDNQKEESSNISAFNSTQ